MNYWTQSEKNIYVAAHRGASASHPENTMEAFRAAIEMGVDQIETDVRITADGELVLIHDATVDRTTNGTGKVAQMTLAELQALDAGCKKDPAFTGAKIPTFRDLLELVKDHPTMTLDIELKEYPTEGWEEIAFSVCDKILALLEEYGYTDRCVINSFSGKLNEYVYKKYNGRYKQHVFYPQKHLGVCEIDPYSYAYCACMFGPDAGMSEKEAFTELKNRGVQTWVGASVCDERTVDIAIDHGAVLVTCNNPDVILDILRKKGRHA